MPKLASEAIVPVDELSTDYDTTTDTSTEGDDDEVLHPTCSAIGHLPDGSSVSIIGQSDGDTQTILEHLCQGDLSLPREVRSELDAAVEVVPIRSSDTDTTDLVLATYLLDEHVDTGDEVVEVKLDIDVRPCLDRSIDDDVTTGVYDTEDGVGASEVYTYYIGFFHELMMCLL